MRPKENGNPSRKGADGRIVAGGNFAGTREAIWEESGSTPLGRVHGGR